MWEFLLDFVGRPPFHQANQVDYRQFWRDRHEHVDVIARQNTFDDLDAVLGTDLTADIADPQAQLAVQYLEELFRGPNQVVAKIVDAMLAGRILR